MKRKVLPILSLIFLLVFSACSGQDASSSDVAIAVALTQTAAALAEANTATPIAEQPTAAQPAAEAVEQPVRIELQPLQTGWYTNGDLSAGSAHYVLAGLAGQQVTIWLNPSPAPDAAALHVRSADGAIVSTSPEVYWSMVLPSSQDYFIDINPLGEDEAVTYQITIELSPSQIDPALGAMYDLIPDTLCQEMGAAASEALNVNFTVQTRAPFFDSIGGEAGQGCRLVIVGNGTMFTNPGDIVITLINSVGLGWTEQLGYAADGPTGSSVGLTRDMGLMLISATWEPEMGVECPTDQPISACDLSPEQMIYTIKVDIAQYNASFSLDGEWNDADTGFSLNLFQDWKNIYGNHMIVAQDGNKIDTLDVSINGTLKGQIATVQFQSAFSSDPGTAQITYLDVNTIQWKIIEPPDGEYYLPEEAILTR